MENKKSMSAGLAWFLGIGSLAFIFSGALFLFLHFDVAVEHLKQDYFESITLPIFLSAGISIFSTILLAYYVLYPMATREEQKAKVPTTIFPNQGLEVGISNARVVESKPRIRSRRRERELV